MSVRIGRACQTLGVFGLGEEAAAIVVGHQPHGPLAEHAPPWPAPARRGRCRCPGCGSAIAQKSGRQAAMQQAAVSGSSPVLHAADQIRSDRGRLPCRAAAARSAKKLVAEPIPLRLVAEQVRLVGGDFLAERRPIRDRRRAAAAGGGSSRRSSRCPSRAAAAAGGSTAASSSAAKRESPSADRSTRRTGAVARPSPGSTRIGPSVGGWSSVIGPWCFRCRRFACGPSAGDCVCAEYVTAYGNGRGRITAASSSSPRIWSMSSRINSRLSSLTSPVRYSWPRPATVGGGGTI